MGVGFVGGWNGACYGASPQSLLWTSRNKEVIFQNSRSSLLQTPHPMLQLLGSLGLGVQFCFMVHFALLTLSILTFGLILSLSKTGSSDFVERIYSLFLASLLLFLWLPPHPPPLYFAVSLPPFSCHLRLSLRTLGCSYAWPDCHRPPGVRWGNVALFIPLGPGGLETTWFWLVTLNRSLFLPSNS